MRHGLQRACPFVASEQLPKPSVVQLTLPR
jgi:hypothetical protein